MSLDDLNSATEVAAEVTPIVETPAAPEPVERDARADLEKLWDKMNQPREADGKFSPPAEKPVEAPKSEPATPDPVSPVLTGEAPKAPVSWAKDNTEAWAKLDPYAREYVLKREQEFEKGIQAKAEKYKPYEPLIEEIEKLRPQLAAKGIPDPHHYFRSLAAVNDAFERDPVNTLLELAKRAGVQRHLAQHFGQTGQQHPDAYVQQQMQELAALREEVRQLRDEKINGDVSAMQAQIDAFARENPHFDELRQDIAQLIGTGVAKDLPDAYRRALRARDDLFEKEVEAKAKAKADELAKAAAEAKKKASLNVRSTPAAPGKPTSMRDTMASVWDRVHDAA